MSKILQDTQSDLLNKFFPYINKEYLNDRLIFFYEKIFKNQPNINMEGTIDDKINQLLSYFKFDIRNYYDNKEFIAINYLRILSDNNIEDAKLRYIIFYCTCFNAKQADYKVFQVNNNFYITVTANKKKTVKFSSINDIKNDNLNIKKNALKLPSHFQYYIERRDHYSKLLMYPLLNEEITDKLKKLKQYNQLDTIKDPFLLKASKDPSATINNMSDDELKSYLSQLYPEDINNLVLKYIKTKPLIVKLDMSFMFEPIQNNTFVNLMNNLKQSSENNNLITLLLCEYIVTQYIKNNYKTHIDYTYTTVSPTTGSPTTSGENQLNNLQEIGNKIRSWVNKIILPKYYTTTSVPTVQGQTIINPPNKDTIINNSLIDIYLRSNINNINKNIIDMLKEKYNDAFILDLYAILYHRSSGLHLTKQFTHPVLDINTTSGTTSGIVEEPLSSIDYIFTTNNIITNTGKEWKSNLYNLTTYIEPGLSSKINQESIKNNSFDPYYHYINISGRSYNQREMYYIQIINKINQYIITLDDTGSNDRLDYTKQYNRNELLKSYYDLTNVLLINLIRLLQIDDIKNNSDIYSKISVFNIYFKLGFDEFYILNKEFDKANKNYDNRMFMLYLLVPLTDITGKISATNTDVMAFRMIALKQFFEEYNYIPLYTEQAYNLDINSDEYLRYITDSAMRSSCYLQWSNTGAQAILACVQLCYYPVQYYSRIFKSKFERETSILS